jgi:hypothetical protein
VTNATAAACNAHHTFLVLLMLLEPITEDYTFSTAVCLSVLAASMQHHDVTVALGHSSSKYYSSVPLPPLPPPPLLRTGHSESSTDTWGGSHDSHPTFYPLSPPVCLLLSEKQVPRHYCLLLLRCCSNQLILR